MGRVVGVQIVLELVAQARELLQLGVDLGLFVLRFPASGQLLDPVQALIDELDVKLDPLIGIGLVVANLLDLVVGQRIVLVLGEKLWGESGGDQEEKIRQAIRRGMGRPLWVPPSWMAADGGRKTLSR